VSPDVSSHVDTDTIDRTRKRFVRRQWTRRWLRWRAVLVLALLVALVAASIWLVFFSTVLAVKGVEVRGTEVLTTQQVREAAAVPSGEPLARVDLDAIAARIRALAIVKSVDVTRAWPDRIRITVHERTAVAVVAVGSGFKAIDEDGVLFRDFARRPSELPLITAPADIGRDAMKEGADVVAALPDDTRALVDHVEVESIDRISLILRDQRVVVWGSAEESARKAEVLDALLEARPAVTTYDVSVPGTPTTRRD